MSFTLTALTAVALAANHVSALAIPTSSNELLNKRYGYPFNQLVAFGDELSDNGNGSFAHGITGDPANVYGFGTWTDGPVAVSYLADMLDVPLTDYAFGGCCGGGTIGAVLDNSYTTKAAKLNNGATVPSLKEQVRSNYTATAKGNIQNSMHFIWIGQNDLPYQTNAFWEDAAMNTNFAKEYSSRVLAEAEYLVSQGAPYVFVANLYPKHLSPVTKTYLCPDGGCVDTWGRVISKANTALKNALAASPNASKFIYWDSFYFISYLLQNKDAWGYTASPDAICDGDPKVAQWDTCIKGSYVWEGAEKFYWFNYVQPSTRVHHMIAMAMKARIDTFFSEGQ